MIDMKKAIEAKSNQLNADDLIGGPITVKIIGVKEGSKEQPIVIHYQGDSGKPWLPCKTMCRVLTGAWGLDGSQYVGKHLTLYRDPDVKWAGEAVGVEIRDVSTSYDRASIDKLKAYYKDRLDAIKSNEAPF